MIDHLNLILCHAEGTSHAGASDGESKTIPTKLSALTAAQCHQNVLNTSAQFTALARSSQAAIAEPLQQAVAQLQADTTLDVVLLFPPTHRNSCETWHNSPARLAALSENPAPRIAAVVFRVSTLQELGFAEVSVPVWDVIIRSSQKPGSCQAVQLGEEFVEQGSQDAPSLPELAPSFPDRSWNWLKSHLDAVSPEELVSEVASTPDGIALKAGLFQIHDYLEASHELSQSVQGRGRNAAGDYWHAIMHRREPDYSNAKYWFRNVGSHPVFDALARIVDSRLSRTHAPAADAARKKLLPNGRWDPFAFVDFCQECNRGGDSELTQIAKQIQWAEMQLLLDQTNRDASTESLYECPN